MKEELNGLKTDIIELTNTSNKFLKRRSIFNFEVKEKIEKPVVTSYIDPKENNLYEDKVGKHSKHSNDYGDSFEEGYDDSEDTNELTSSMHEIDIFSDYVPLDD